MVVTATAACKLRVVAAGACKYIQPGFVKLCKATASGDAHVTFLKHNVYSEEEEEVTEIGRHYSVKSVPMFKFFRAGEELESFATRERARIAEAINKHAGEGTVEM